MTIKEIRHIFEKNANIENARRDTKYMRNLFPHYGVRSKQRDILFRNLFANPKSPLDWNLVHDLWAEPMRECQYLAIGYLWVKRGQLTKSDIPTIKTLIETKSWWDTIDGLDGIIGNIVMRDPSLKDVMIAWSLDDNFWLRRIALQHQLNFKNDVDIDLLDEIIRNNLGEIKRSSPSIDGLDKSHNRAFFLNKSIGWVLREYSKINPDWVRNFIAKNKDKMSKLSIREASKYI